MFNRSGVRIKQVKPLGGRERKKWKSGETVLKHVEAHLSNRKNFCMTGIKVKGGGLGLGGRELGAA